MTARRLGTLDSVVSSIEQALLIELADHAFRQGPQPGDRCQICAEPIQAREGAGIADRAVWIGADGVTRRRWWHLDC